MLGFRLRVSCAIEDGIDAIGRSMVVMSFFLNKHHKKNLDILIEPAAANYSWTDFFSYQELIRIGETAAELKLGEIRNALKTKFGDNALQ